jgi:cyclopropane-fatty-acyl-phospholipid synthase
MASYVPTFVARPIGYGTDLLRTTLGGLTWGPALIASKKAVTSILERIELGTLVVIDEATGKAESYGQKLAKEHRKLVNAENGKKGHGAKRVELLVRNESFWVRVALFGDMGFAEAYMLGEIECADLTAFFEVCSTLISQALCWLTTSSFLSTTVTSFPTQVL